MKKKLQNATFSLYQDYTVYLNNYIFYWNLYLYNYIFIGVFPEILNRRGVFIETFITGIMSLKCPWEPF